ncbi:MAG: hypothetical protein WCX73_04495 [Candidatus Pacearchaeota archaeon]|jgi:hypothetical protein
MANENLILRISELENIFKESLENMQDSFHSIEKNRTLDFLSLDGLLYQKKEIEGHYQRTNNFFAEYVELTGGKVNPEYTAYTTCVNTVFRIINKKIKKVEDENIKKINSE